MSDEKSGLSPDEQAEIDKTIEEAKRNLVSEETKKKVDAAKQEAKQEFEMQRQLEELRKEKEALAKRLEENEKKAQQELDNIKTKLNESIGRSRAPVKSDDPFQEPQSQNFSVDRLSDEEVKDIEQQAAEEFFGPDEYRHFTQ
jgi:predicted RNase H-like nuclease (RuvC/YqgF family)